MHLTNDMSDWSCIFFEHVSFGLDVDRRGQPSKADCGHL